jgi:hypothetical protein
MHCPHGLLFTSNCVGSYPQLPTSGSTAQGGYPAAMDSSEKDTLGCLQRPVSTLSSMAAVLMDCTSNAAGKSNNPCVSNVEEVHYNMKLTGHWQRIDNEVIILLQQHGQGVPVGLRTPEVPHAGAQCCCILQITAPAWHLSQRGTKDAEPANVLQAARHAQHNRHST